uniref:NFATC2-interacting protein n=1 Tax=Labrus bergylta TaxID=56723 RepID=A0A3Q3EMD6_9LABR
HEEKSPKAIHKCHKVKHIYFQISKIYLQIHDAPLGSVFSLYMSNMSAVEQRKVRFHFDGSKVTNIQTPAQLDMEDGDIIEVWI